MLKFLLNYLACPVGLVPPGGHGSLVDATEVIDGEEVDALDLAHALRDVARLGDIDQDQVAGLAVERPEAFFHSLTDTLRPDYRVRCGGARYDDVGESDVAVEVLEVDRQSPDLLCKHHSAVIGSVGDVDCGEAFRGQGLRHQHPHLPAAYHQDVPVAQGAKEFLCKRHRSGTD